MAVPNSAFERALGRTTIPATMNASHSPAPVPPCSASVSAPRAGMTNKVLPKVADRDIAINPYRPKLLSRLSETSKGLKTSFFGSNPPFDPFSMLCALRAHC